MKLRLVLLSLFALCLAVTPAIAQNDVYDNGPINGSVDGWTINEGFVVSDQLTLDRFSEVNGLEFAVWLFPGDVLQTADVTISSQEFGGTTFFAGTVAFTQSGCSSNQYGFNVCVETGSFANVGLNAGTYWLNLQNAVVNSGDPVYWDENDGPSRASENSLGTIPSESFTILGQQETGTTSTTSTTSTTPEPTSLMLFGSGVLGLAGVLRRRLF